MRAVLEIGGAALTLLGVLIGVYGTFVMTKFYHPYGPVGFLVSMIRMIGRMLVFQGKKNKEHVDVAAAFAELTPEKKGESLSGAHWLFLGFFLETLGAALITVDACIVNLKPHWFD